MENVVRIDSAKIDEIWKKYVKNPKELNPRDNIVDRGYHIEEELPKDGILFLGMNPSYPKESKDRTYIDKEKDQTGKELETFFYGTSYNLEKIKETCFKQKEDLKDEDIRTQKYWKPIVDAAVRIIQENTLKKEDIERELKFCHHDLFFVRETSQNKVLALKAKCGKFFNDQWKYSKGIIEKASPKIIIVINGGAGNLIREELGTDFFGFIPGASWNEECGVDIVKIGEREVPIIFTGMLSSTGRINKGTETTLFWNIRHIARQLKITF